MTWCEHDFLTPECLYFIQNFPDEVIGHRTLVAATGLDAARVLPKFVDKNGLHVYSKDVIFEVARAQFRRCVDWLRKVEQLHRRTISKNPSKIPDTLLWKHSYFWCNACNIVLDNPTKHIKSTHECCKPHVERRWIPITSDLPQPLTDPHWCLWCNESFEKREVDDHLARCHFGVGKRVTFMVPGIRDANPELRRIRKILEEEDACKQWSSLWKDAYIVRSHEVNKIVPILRSGVWRGKSVCAIVRTTGVVRHCIRQRMKGSEITLATRGDKERVLLAWKESDVERLLLTVLPKDLVVSHLIPEIKSRYAADDEYYRKKYSSTKRRHVWTCDRCGVSSDDVDILHSKYVPGHYCDVCIEDDDDLNEQNHNWQDI